VVAIKKNPVYLNEAGYGKGASPERPRGTEELPANSRWMEDADGKG